MHKTKALLACILIASTLLSACGAGNVPTAIVKVGWTAEPDTLNPGMAVLTESFSIFNLIYDTLYELDLDGTYRLSLADSADVSENGKTWTFQLRDNVTFSDGEPLTAEDVVYSYNLYSENVENFIFLPQYTAYFESVTAPSKYEVVITLTEAIPNMESQLFGLYILPKHIWENVADPTITDLSLQQSVGSGPFHLTEYVKGQYIRLESQPEHFFYHPLIGGVEFRFYSDVASMVQALANKEIDVITNLPVDAVTALDGVENVRVVAGPPVAPNVSDIIINQSTPATCPRDSGGLCTGHPALRDRNVRLAMAHAIDKERLIDEVMLGLADPGLTLIPKGLGSFYNATIKDYEYDVDRANQILEDVGYLDTDNDGVREMPGSSQELLFRLEWPSDVLYARAEAELLKVMWAQIGIDVVMNSVDSDELTARCCPMFDYDIMLWEWGSDPDPNFLLSVMLTEELASGYNESGYSNPVYDELYHKQATELDDEERRSIIWQMQNIVHSDVVYIIPFYQRAIQAYRTDTFSGWLTDSGKLDLDAPSSLGIIEPINR